MLTELVVRNLALAEDVHIEFGPGLNVLTGETGAGKSIVVGALNLLLGGKASPDLIRSGSETALVEGYFDASGVPGVTESLEILGILPDVDGDIDADVEGPNTVTESSKNPMACCELIFSREISRTGKSRCRVNGRTVSAQQLKELGSSLVDICGQHENQSLFAHAKQLALLDRLGGSELIQVRTRLAAVYKDLRESVAMRDALEEKSREMARNADLLAHQIAEIRGSRLDGVDETALREERSMLQNMDKLMGETARVYAELTEGSGSFALSDAGIGRDGGGRAGGSSSGGALIDSLGQITTIIESLAKLDKSLESILHQLATAWEMLKEAARSLRQYREGLEGDPEQLSAIEEKLDLLARLKRKYGDSIEAILAFAAQAESELDAFTSSDEMLRELNRTITRLESEYFDLAATASQQRRGTAKALSAQLEQELTDLNMDRAVFQVAFASSNPSSTGTDRVDFVLSPNPGEEPRPIARIASGGELSRILLAIKTVLGQYDDLPTMVFDEIDAGIGGLTATAVAAKLIELARLRQVVCVTHLAQIACMADRQMLIYKEEREGRTRTEVEVLDEDSRIIELARMLGSHATEPTVRLVREMLDTAQACKSKK